MQLYYKRIKNFFKHLANTCNISIEKKNYYYINDIATCFYLTGFYSSNAHLLLSLKKNYYFTDNRYYYAAKRKIKVAEVNKISNSLSDSIRSKLNDSQRLIIFSKSITLDKYLELQKFIKSSNLIISDFPLASSRAIKDQNEIDILKENVKILKRVFEKLPRYFKYGISEFELKNIVDRLVLENGAEKTAFDTIVVFGKNTANPHSISNPKAYLEKNDIILIDCGAKFKHYCSDITRVYFVGTAKKKAIETYKILLNIQQETIKQLKPNIKISDIELDILKKLDVYKMTDRYLHSTGHGVGLEIHETPIVNKSNTSYLKEGYVITIEPGVYFPNKFGIRCEDMILITQNGYENLTKDIPHFYA